MQKLTLTATAEMARQYWQLFVNRRAYTRQSKKPHPESGRHYYFRPKAKAVDVKAALTLSTIRQHLEGRLTIGLYAINPQTQRSKWVAIDADYKDSLADLLKLQYELWQDGVHPALEKSRRGGHLWIFFQRPVLARDARIYIYHLAERLDLSVKGAGLPEGIEIFPRQDELAPEEFGNALRGPLGVHWGSRKRYWFYDADYEPVEQLAYLRKLPKLSEEELRRFIDGKSIPVQYQPAPVNRATIEGRSGSRNGEFCILDYVEAKRKVGRNWVTQCPSCALNGHDNSGDNLAVLASNPRYYKCWAGCTKEMIRAAVGKPIPERRLA